MKLYVYLNSNELGIHANKYFLFLSNTVIYIYTPHIFAKYKKESNHRYNRLILTPPPQSPQNKLFLF